MALSLHSCGLKDEEIPGYIHVSDYQLDVRGFEGSNSSKVNAIWVLQNNLEQGVYELPATFPVLPSNGTNLKILAGITVNGISTTHIDYPFYTFHEYDHALEAGKTDTLVPQWDYADFSSFVFIEDFESGNGFLNINRVDNPSQVFEGDVSGKMQRDTVFSSQYFQAATVEHYFIPRSAPFVYLEMDYKNNVSFGVGLEARQINNPQTITFIKLNVNPQEEWNKIYINLFPDIQTLDADEYRIIFRVQNRDISDEEVKIFFDNIKLIYARDI
ncbi:MAG: hypothetical protein WD048_10300 [Chitinophagales bacterium]